MTMPEPSGPEAGALEYAKGYASLGWRVVPIAPGTQYPKGLAKWQEHATDDLEIIENWWTGIYKGFGVGIATGPGSGVWAMDVDVKDGKPGRASFAALEAEHGKFEPTPTTVSGTGGIHLFFAWDDDHPVRNFQQGPGGEDKACPFGPGIDVRGEGGFVVAAPTVHPKTGTLYQWHEGRDPRGLAPVDAPAWAYRLLERDQKEQLVAAAPEGPAPKPSTDVRDPGRQSNSTPDSIADHIRDTNDYASLLSADGWAHMHDQGDKQYWCRPGKSPRDGHSAVLHNHGDGPLNVFTTEDVGLAGVGTTTGGGTCVSYSIVDYMAGTRYGGDLQGMCREVRSELNRSKAETSKVSASERPIDVGLDDGTPLAEAREVAQTSQASKFMDRLLDGHGILNLEPPEPMVGTYVDRGMVAEIAGPFGSGKSFLLMELGLSVATGRPWMGQEIHHTGEVIHVMAEGAYTAPDRIRAWLERNNAADLPERFKIYPDRFDLTDPESWRPLHDALATGAIAPAALLLDTRSRLTSGDENSKEPTERLVQACDEMRQLCPGMSIIIAHHTGHAGSGRGRGHSSFEQDIDVVLALEGQLKDGHVKIVDQKQKARETNEPMYFVLEKTDSGMPYIRATTEPPDGGDAEGYRVSELVLRVITNEPGEWTARGIEKDPPVTLAGVGTQKQRADAVRGLANAGLIAEQGLPNVQGRRLVAVKAVI